MDEASLSLPKNLTPGAPTHRSSSIFPFILLVLVLQAIVCGLRAATTPLAPAVLESLRDFSVGFLLSSVCPLSVTSRRPSLLAPKASERSLLSSLSLLFTFSRGRKDRSILWFC